MTAIQSTSKSFLPLALSFALVFAAACAGSAAPSRQSKTSYGGGHGNASSESSGSRRVASTSTYAEAGTSAYGESGPSDYGDSNDSPSQDSLAEESTNRPGLGTRFGERRESTVQKRRFKRASSSPFAQVALHYNSQEGIEQQSWYRGTRIEELRAQTNRGGISISLIDPDTGRLLRGGTGGGRTYVIGSDGQRYTLQVRNDTGGTYEVVSSVDGLDVVDGRPASTAKRGYIIQPYSTLNIEGFRTSLDSVAAFRFGSVDSSYAAQTSGDRNVGVIGFAFFAERGSRWSEDEIRQRETANPFPGGFSRPPGIAR